MGGAQKKLKAEDGYSLGNILENTWEILLGKVLLPLARRVCVRRRGTT